MKRIILSIILITVTSLTITTGFTAQKDPGTVRVMGGCPGAETYDPESCYK